MEAGEGSDIHSSSFYDTFTEIKIEIYQTDSIYSTLM